MSFNLSHIHQKWLHSYEEDTPDTIILRPESYAFPPSRGRAGYELREGGEATRIAPGPADRRVYIPGTWSIDSSGLITMRFEGRQTETLQVGSVEQNRLVLNRAGRTII